MTRFACALALCVLAGCGGEDEAPDEVLARVGERAITLDQFRAELERRSEILGGGYGTRDQQRELLAALVDHERLLATAEALELDHDPEVQAALDRVLTSAVRRELERRAVADVEVDDEEVAAWYEAHRGDYAQPERRNVAIIHSAAVTDADRRRLESVREEARAAGGIHFGELAIDHSDDRSSRYRGGVIGWLRADRRGRYKWPDAVVDAAFELGSVGELSDVIVTDEGLYLVRLAALEPGGARPLDEVADGIRAALRRQKVRDARERALDAMSGGIEVVVYDERLDEIGARVADAEPRTPPALPARGDS